MEREDKMERKIKELMKRKEGYGIAQIPANKELQKKAKKICFQYNQTGPDEGEKRSELLQQLFGTYHPLTFIEPSFHCDFGFNIHMHGLTVINFNCVILDTSTVDIGANAFIAPGVCISCAGHSMDKEQRGNGIMNSKPITIEDDVWIGANSVICGGVTIGSGTVIGAGSVVNKDIPSGVVAAGVPCKVIRELTEEDKIEYFGEEYFAD